jgi:hypothetical protein
LSSEALPNDLTGGRAGVVQSPLYLKGRLQTPGFTRDLHRPQALVGEIVSDRRSSAAGEAGESYYNNAERKQGRAAD